MKKRVVTLMIAMAGVLALASAWRVYDQIKQKYHAALVAQRQLEAQLGALQAEQRRLSEALTVEQARSAELSETLSDKDAELERTIERLQEEERVAREFEQQLQAMTQRNQLLQGELAAALEATESVPRTPSPFVQLERVIVTQPASSGSLEPGLQGRIISVHPEWKFIVIDFGWDVVKVGDTVSIYRNDALLGKARVERVQEAAAAATLLLDADPAEIHVNDAVRLL